MSIGKHLPFPPCIHVCRAFVLKCNSCFIVPQEHCIMEGWREPGVCTLAICPRCLKYAREFDADRKKLRRHCCSECYQTQGLTHNKHCARIPLEIHATEETANMLQQHCLNIFKTRTCRGEDHFRKHIRNTTESSRMRKRSRSPHVATSVDAHTHVDTPLLFTDVFWCLLVDMAAKAIVYCIQTRIYNHMLSM